MKYYRSIYIHEQGFPADLYQEIVRLKPKCRKNDIFMLEAQPGEEVMGQLAEKIAALCEQRGLKRTAGTVGTYGYQVVRKYDVDDLAAVSYLRLDGSEKMFEDFSDSKKRDDGGLLVVPAAQATGAVKIAFVFPTNWLVVSDVVRQQLESADLIGLQFAKVVLKGTSKNAAKHPFWELKASVVLPKMVNSVIDTERGSYTISDPPYRNCEPHYRQRELLTLGLFDIAYTYETRELITPERSLVISQKFYQCCLQNEIPLEVTPVRIDPD